jgi:hypothetical protein
MGSIIKEIGEALVNVRKESNLMQSFCKNSAHYGVGLPLTPVGTAGE